MGKEFKRVKNGDSRESLLLKDIPYFNKNTKIPLKVKEQAEELGFSVQDWITMVLLKELENIGNESINKVNGSDCGNNS